MVDDKKLEGSNIKIYELYSEDRGSHAELGYLFTTKPEAGILVASIL